MNGMKIPMALIFAVVLQAIGLVWYVSKIDKDDIIATLNISLITIGQLQVSIYRLL